MRAENVNFLQEPVAHGIDMRMVSRDTLRALVPECTRSLRDAGMPPENVLIGVRALVREAIAADSAPHSDLEDRSTLIADASTWYIEAYYDRSGSTGPRAGEPRIGNSVARKSLSRRLLLRLLVLHPELPRDALASRLSVAGHQLLAYAAGAQLMPYAVQESLVALVLEQEPQLARLAHRLRVQIQAARRYEAGEVVGHLSCPRGSW